MSGVNRVLFDAPGPRARRRIAVATVVSVLVMIGLAVLGLVQLAHNGQLVAAKWTLFARPPIVRFMLSGAGMTLGVAAVSALLATPLGALLALGRMSANPVLRVPATVVIEFFRSVPLLVVIYVFLLAIPKSGYVFPVFWQLVIPIVLCSGAVFAEIFRAGVLALDRGQSEAAFAVGMRRGQVMRIIVFPQAVRLVVPTLVSQLVSLLKDSTLGYVVSLSELLNQAKDLSSFYHLFLQSYTIVAVVYIVINASLSQLAHALERRAHRRPRAGGSTDAQGGAAALDTGQLRATV